MNRLNSIMLIDDSKDDNFIHERIIRKNSYTKEIIVKLSAWEALAFLKDRKEQGLDFPNLIFLDINMPRMNGWEFLDNLTKITDQTSLKTVIIMLTTSENPDDLAKAETYALVSGYKTKPLTKDMLNEIIVNFFNN